MTAYTNEKHAQIVISLLKAHGIRHVIASPGATNLVFVGSIQTDPFFKIYSAVDERSAAYMACGLAAELGEPVVISCTGATASRNYLPGLTEAFYRKLPVLAVTSTQIRARIGHHVAQVIDRSQIQNDVVKLSVELPVVKDEDDVWECEIKVNKAILELTRNGGGPAHINLPTLYSQVFDQKQLPAYRVINRWTPEDELPELKGRVGVFIGSHPEFTPAQTAMLDKFCEVNNAAVFCDHTSSYRGKYRILSALIGGQKGSERLGGLRPETMIHIGEISGDYEISAFTGTEIWRVSPDGEIRDTFRKLRHVFQMSEHSFFGRYLKTPAKGTSYFEQCRVILQETREKLPDLPFSNLWLASQLAHKIPAGSVVHFAILNSLRAWNNFELPKDVRSASNVGGFGIDGCTSSLMGAALANPDKLYYLVTGDLAFFYDLNALGSRHLGANVRILMINNGQGVEFTQHGHAGAVFQGIGGDTRSFVAAEGHFGQKSPHLIRDYAKGLGLDYMAMSGKSDIGAASKLFCAPPSHKRPILIEAFVDGADESEALRQIRNLEVSSKNKARQIAKDLLGAQGIQTAKKLLGR